VKNLHFFALLILAAVRPSPAATVSCTYDAAGRLTRSDYGSGAVSEHSYDDNGNMLSRTSNGGSYTVHTLAYAAGFGGTLTGNALQQVAHNGGGTGVSAVPAAHYRFVRWSDGATGNPRTDLNVTASRSFTAEFAAEKAVRGTPHWWIEGYGLRSGGLTYDQAELTDTDSDDSAAWQEFAAGTDPTDGSSRLRISAVIADVPATVTFTPASVARLYTLQSATNLVGAAWTDVPGQGPRPGTGGQDAMSDSSGAPSRFYRVKVALP
jgi:YD repeat-containing protein